MKTLIHVTSWSWRALKLFFPFFKFYRMSSSLPLTVQDDIEAKERYAAQQQQKNASRSCSTRRIRLWTLIAIVSIAAFLLVTYFKVDTRRASHIITDDTLLPNNDDTLQEKAPKAERFGNLKNDHDNSKEKPLSLKEEILKNIQEHRLIVFSKTYCP
jgi:hypothetical protein